MMRSLQRAENTIKDIQISLITELYLIFVYYI